MEKKAKWFEQIFNNSGVGVLIVNKSREIIEINGTFCEMIGYKYEEIIGKSAEILHMSKQAYLEFGKIAFNPVLGEKSLSVEYKFRHKSGNPLWVKVTGDVIKEDKEVIWIMTDITQRVKFQEELTKLNETLNSKIKYQVDILREKDNQIQYQARLAQMGEMLNMISHQWRQPLMSISATINYLYAKIYSEEFDKKQFLEELSLMESSTEYLSQTISDFRTFFIINKEKRLTTFKEIIESTLKIINPILSNNHVKITTDFITNTKIEVFENEIRHVLLTIIKNSEDAFIERNIENRDIKIKTYEKDNYAILELSDNAKGIKKKHLKKVFDAYFTTKASNQGSGLGLCMSKTIIEENCKGTLEVKSSDIGATFTIKLPIKIDN